MMQLGRNAYTKECQFILKVVRLRWSHYHLRVSASIKFCYITLYRFPRK